MCVNGLLVFTRVSRAKNVLGKKLALARAWSIGVIEAAYLTSFAVVMRNYIHKCIWELGETRLMRLSRQLGFVKQISIFCIGC